MNDGLEFLYRRETENGEFVEQRFCYQKGLWIMSRSCWRRIRKAESLRLFNLSRPSAKVGIGRSREYKVKFNVCFAFSNRLKLIEHYHNSSWLEYGGSPDKAMRQAFVSQIDAYLKANNKYNKNESKINFSDIEDCLIFVSNNFSTQTSYENQTKRQSTTSLFTTP